MDMLAIPDFAAGAMENYGCVTYRETAILWDPEKSAASAKQRVAEVVAHELAHQWYVLFWSAHTLLPRIIRSQNHSR